jgi:hypothetical protein
VPAKKAAAAAVAASPAAGEPLPLADRSVDYWFVVWYVVFWFTVM